MRKKWWVILIFIAMVFIAAVLFITNGLTEGRTVELQGVNLADKPDGDYTGTYSFKRWANTLLIQVQDHQITDIEIQSDMLFPMPGCSEEMFLRVIHAQDTMVDTVSGATVTSKAYLKAIENALD